MFRIKTLLVGFGLSLALLSAGSTPSLASQFSCDALLSESGGAVGAAKTSVAQNKIYAKLQLSSAEVQRLDSLLVANGLAKSSSNKIVRIIEDMVIQLENNPSLNYQGRADVVGEVALGLHPMIHENRPYPESSTGDVSAPREARSIMSAFAEAIHHFERFTESDFVSDQSLAMSRPNNPIHFVRLDDLKRWVESYVDGSGIYYTEIPDRGAGILGFADIRDTASHNRWVIEMKGHDMKHAHYLYGHPWGANAYFRSARSKNAIRYTMMGGLFEGVDTVQYSWESQLTRHFDNVLKMRFEDSLVYMGILPTRVLRQMQQDLGLGEMGGALAIFSAWRPKKFGDFQPEGFSGKGLDNDLTLMMQKNYDLLIDPAMRKYTNFSMHSDRVRGGGVDADDKRVNHY